MLIEVFGPGCARCQLTGRNVRETVRVMGLDDTVKVAEIHDIQEMAARNVLMTPAVFIDGVKVCQGKVPSPKEVRQWLEDKGKDTNPKSSSCC